MKRIDVRSVENWRRFDFWAIIICLLILLIMLVAWLAGARFGGEECCQDDVATEQVAPAPVVEPEPIPEPEPEPVVEPEPIEIPKVDYALNFFKAGDKVILEGAVADLITLNEIVDAAKDLFGAGNVISNLSVIDNVLAFDTSKLGSIFEQMNGVDDFRLAISPAQWSIFGNVSDESVFNSFGDAFANLTGTSVDNQLTLVEVKPELNCELLLSLNSVEFAFNSAEITDAGKQAIAQVMQCLSNNSYDIVGHTDASGDADANQVLSLERAGAVRDYLTSLGVDTSAYTVTGKGETEPLMEGESLEANSRNRRVEFKPL